MGGRVSSEGGIDVVKVVTTVKMRMVNRWEVVKRIGLLIYMCMYM